MGGFAKEFIIVIIIQYAIPKLNQIMANVVEEVFIVHKVKPNVNRAARAIMNKTRKKHIIF